MSVSDKMKFTPQKRLLGLDGGGTRGLITLHVLARFESILRETKAEGNPDFRLADYFDYIGGTSTGAIIAAALAIRMSVAEISHFYHTSAIQMFTRAGYLQRFRDEVEDKVGCLGRKAVLDSEQLLERIMPEGQIGLCGTS